jgi:MFS family permease
MKKRHLVLALLSILSTVVYLDRVCISVSGKRIKADLGLSNEQFGWVLGAFALSYALFEIPTGMMGDRLGPKKVLSRVVLWWSGFTALTGLAFNFIYLLVIRFLFGAGEAGAYPNSSIVIARWFPKYETGKAQAFIWAFGRIGGALAPLMVVPMALAFGWRVSFAVMGLIGVAWVLCWWFWFRNEPKDIEGISTEELSEITANRRYQGPSNHSIPWKELFGDKNVLALMGMFHFFIFLRRI